MAQKIFKPGDELTIEDVRESMRRAEEAGRFTINENCGVKPVEENGCLVFETEEDMEKYFGKLYTIEEAFYGKED